MNGMGHGIELFGGPLDGHRMTVQNDRRTLRFPMLRPLRLLADGEMVRYDVAVYEYANRGFFTYGGMEYPVPRNDVASEAQ